MACCNNPDLMVQPHGKMFWFACFNCGFNAKDIYQTTEDARVALLKYLSSNSGGLEIIFGKKEPSLIKHINFNESLKPIMKSGLAASFLFFSDLMIEKCGLPNKFLAGGANRRANDKGPFLTVYFYSRESEVPSHLNMIIPTRHKDQQKRKGILFGMIKPMAYLGFKYYPTSELPFTMDTKEKNKMIIDLSELYQKNSDVPLIRYKKGPRFRKKNYNSLALEKAEE